MLWSRLRRKQIAGLRFRRQHPIGPYIADFYCHEASLVIEIDSRFHADAESVRHDRARDLWMHRRDIGVLRVHASDITEDLDGVVRTILKAAKRRMEPSDE